MLKFRSRQTHRPLHHSTERRELDTAHWRIAQHAFLRLVLSASVTGRLTKVLGTLVAVARKGSFMFGTAVHGISNTRLILIRIRLLRVALLPAVILNPPLCRRPRVTKPSHRPFHPGRMPSRL